MKFTGTGCHWSQEFSVMGQKKHYMVNKAIWFPVTETGRNIELSTSDLTAISKLFNT